MFIAFNKLPQADAFYWTACAAKGLGGAQREALRTKEWKDYKTEHPEDFGIRLERLGYEQPAAGTVHEATRRRRLKEIMEGGAGDLKAETYEEACHARDEATQLIMSIVRLVRDAISSIRGVVDTVTF